MFTSAVECIRFTFVNVSRCPINYTGFLCITVLVRTIIIIIHVHKFYTKYINLVRSLSSFLYV